MTTYYKILHDLRSKDRSWKYHVPSKQEIRSVETIIENIITDYYRNDYTIVWELCDQFEDHIFLYPNGEILCYSDVLCKLIKK